MEPQVSVFRYHSLQRCGAASAVPPSSRFAGRIGCRTCMNLDDVIVNLSLFAPNRMADANSFQALLFP